MKEHGQSSIYLRIGESGTIFAFFVLGVITASLLRSFFPDLLQGSEKMIFAPSFFLMPSLLAFLCGITILGQKTIPLVSFLFGAYLCSLSDGFYRGLISEEFTSLAFILPIVSVPIFFLVGTLGMRNARVLCRALRTSGSRAECDVRRCCSIMLLFLASLVLCYLMIHSTLYR